MRLTAGLSVIAATAPGKSPCAAGACARAKSRLNRRSARTSRSLTAVSGGGTVAAAISRAERRSCWRSVAMRLDRSAWFSDWAMSSELELSATVTRCSRA
jgi:hypothetical protein